MYLNLVTSVIIHSQSLGCALSLIITTSHTCRYNDPRIKFHSLHLSCRHKFAIFAHTENERWKKERLHTNRVNIPPVCLLLRMLQWVSINLTRTGQQEPRTNSLCQPQHVQSAHHIGLVLKWSRRQ